MVEVEVEPPANTRAEVVGKFPTQSNAASVGSGPMRGTLRCQRTPQAVFLAQTQSYNIVHMLATNEINQTDPNAKRRLFVEQPALRVNPEADRSTSKYSLRDSRTATATRGRRASASRGHQASQDKRCPLQ